MFFGVNGSSDAIAHEANRVPPEINHEGHEGHEKRCFFVTFESSWFF